MKLKGTQVEVRYIEYQASDHCESYSAIVSLAGPKPTAVQNRLIGTVTKDACRLGKESAPVA